jgi:hypothetical protein
MHSGGRSGSRTINNNCLAFLDGHCQYFEVILAGDADIQANERPKSEGRRVAFGKSNTRPDPIIQA